MNSISPRHGGKASYYPVVCFETGEVKWMELEGNSTGAGDAVIPGDLWPEPSGGA